MLSEKVYKIVWRKKLKFGEQQAAETQVSNSTRDCTSKMKSRKLRTSFIHCQMLSPHLYSGGGGCTRKLTQACQSLQ